MGRKITKLAVSEPIPTRKKVAAYARVSCGKDEMLHSLAAQVSYYKEYIQSQSGWDFAGVYADEAVTGTKDNRAEFSRMLADCQSGKIDRVITKSISRFARNTVTLLETVRSLGELDIDVFFEEQNLHTASADGELLLTILASYAQEESRSVSENCKWRIRKDYQEGKLTGGVHMYGYDFRDGMLVVNPQEAEVVRMIFADYLSGMGRNAMMRKLIRLGIPTKLGGRWAENTVASILSNEKVVGDLCLQKGFIADHLTKQKRVNRGELPKYYVEGAHEAIIGRETFDAVQAEVARRAHASKPASKEPRSEFSGMIRCGRCGANFTRKINAIGTKYAKANWACATYTTHGKELCAAKRIPEDILRLKCAEALGSNTYDAADFTNMVTAITIPEDGLLVFTFKDGLQRTILWENHSRRDSWTAEMKSKAKDAAKRRFGNG